MPPKKSAASAASNFIAVLGTDEALMKEAAIRLSRELSPPDAGDFGVDIIEGIAESAEHCAQIVRRSLDALQTLPFFGGGKLVWLKNANFLADSQVGKTNAATEGMETILDYVEQQLPPEVKFLLSASAVDKRRSAYKRIQKLADLRTFDKPDTSKTGWEDEVIPLVERRARDLGITFDNDAIEMLVHLAGEDTRQLDSEVEKLSLFLGERTRVTVEDVRLLVPLNRAGVIFELGNAMGKRDLRRALELVRTLVYQGQSPIGILLAAIVPRVKSMLLAADLVARHPRLPRTAYPAFAAALDKLPASETSHLPKKKDGSGLNVYPVFLALGESSKYTAAELRAALQACLDANLKLVTTSIDPQLVLERFLVGMLSKPGQRKAA
ncbi:DNA polymerase III delta subunit [Roseimicrobium gellanilyticum]|uniref:DNA polymerase III delta subunit n=1 Tax=Roseimicrobium gellanilyticum TaxID=748857 RepID=A0A366HB05_9BACT|nr:DNA polymerase III subunit delta [Roseimicrobium gellanilyticum]RBP39089.1 DNA polymerase III delta subunit [Roseimicrobium gellanilyticum]